MISAESARGVLRHVYGSEVFHTLNGEQITSLTDLAHFLKHTDDSVWNHHVTSEKNDFANWAEGVFHAHELAEKIRSSNDRSKLAKTIEHEIEKARKELTDLEKPKIVELKNPYEKEGKLLKKKRKKQSSSFEQSVDEKKGVQETEEQGAKTFAHHKQDQKKFKPLEAKTPEIEKELLHMPLPPSPPKEKSQDSFSNLRKKGPSGKNLLNDSLDTTKEEELLREAERLAKELSDGNNGDTKSKVQDEESSAVSSQQSKFDSMMDESSDTSLEESDDNSMQEKIKEPHLHPKIRARIGPKRTHDEALDELMKQHDDLETKEKKLLEIEKRIEHKYATISPDHKKFFTKEFVFGVLIGVLIMLILGMLFIKIKAPDLLPL